MTDRLEMIKAPPMTALRSLPDRALDAWLRANLTTGSAEERVEEAEIPADLLTLVRTGPWN